MAKLLKLFRFLAVLSVIANAGFIFSGCNDEHNGEDAAEDVGEAVEEAGEDIQDAAD